MVKYGLVDSDSGSDVGMDDTIVEAPLDSHADDDDAPPRQTLRDDDDDDELDEAVDYEAPIYDVSSVSASEGGRRRSCDSDVESRRAMAPEPETPLPVASRRIRAELGLESKRMAVMQKSLFAPSSTHQPMKFEATAALPRSKSIVDERAMITTKPIVTVEPIKPRSMRRRKLQTVPLKEALSRNATATLLDASLALSRSFGACWCQGNQIATSGLVLDNAGASRSFSVVNIETIPILSRPLSKETTFAERLLGIQLQHTAIDVEADVPFASTESHLRFHHFCKGLDVEDRSHEANVWRLGAALFDEIDPKIPQYCKPQAVKRIHAARRETAFSDWLRDAVSSTVDKEIRSTSGQPTPATTFKLLTGYQIDKACDAAIAVGDVRLSTLVPLAGGDSACRSDLITQLSSWREARIDGHIDDDRRRIYEVLSGNVTTSKGYGQAQFQVDASKSIQIAHGLDWKRAFGLHFWYQASHESLWYAVKTYEQAFINDNVAAQPKPWYVEQSRSVSNSDELRQWTLPRNSSIYDPLFHMIKLFVDPGYDLEDLLEPRGFSPSPFDHRIPWHLYTILSRCMRRSDFKDRGTDFDTRREDNNNNGHGGVEGNSIRADTMTKDYACQLEQIGIWHWAAFVLLHLDYPQSRSLAIKSLLERNIGNLNKEQEKFLVDELRIPTEWIAEAQAALAQHEGRIWDQYQLLLKAGLMTEAHRIVIDQLAPEAIIHGDFQLLRRLFEGMGPENVADWPYGGKLFVDYANVVDDLPLKLAASRSGDATATLVVNQRVQMDLPRLLREVPTIYGSKSKPTSTKQTVCISEMLSRLNSVSNQLDLLQEGGQREGNESSLPWSVLQQLQGSDRLSWALSNSMGAFSKALNAACEV